MRAIIKLLTLPIVLTIDVFTWICIGLQNLIGIDPGSTIGGIGVDIPVADVLLAGDVPFCGEG